MKNTIEVNLQSEIFAEFRENLNKAILSCLTEIHAKRFSGGEIGAKISIEFENGVEVYAAGGDENGKAKNEAHHYLKPVIEHKVTLTLKKRAEAKGSYMEDLELKQDDERFILTEPKRAQMSIEEIGKQEGGDD